MHASARRYWSCVLARSAGSASLSRPAARRTTKSVGGSALTAADVDPHLSRGEGEGEGEGEGGGSPTASPIVDPHLHRGRHATRQWPWHDHECVESARSRRRPPTACPYTARQTRSGEGEGSGSRRAPRRRRPSTAALTGLARARPERVRASPRGGRQPADEAPPGRRRSPRAGDEERQEPPAVKHKVEAVRRTPPGEGEGEGEGEGGAGARARVGVDSAVCGATSRRRPPHLRGRGRRRGDPTIPRRSPRELEAGAAPSSP